LALVLYGSSRTENKLKDDGYQNIEVIAPLEEPSVKHLAKIDGLEPGKQNADCNFILAFLGI
jgi:hypothetical protein